MQRSQRSRRRRTLPPTDPVRESRTAEAVTVAWMLAMLATLAAEVAGIATRALLILVGASDWVRVLSVTLLLVALLSGLLTLGLTPISLKVRRALPPRAIVATAVIIGLMPLVTLILLWMREAA